MKKYYLNLALSALLMFTTVPAHAEDALKVATVDIQKLFKEYHRTMEAQKQINEDRTMIQKKNSERQDKLQTLKTQLQGLKMKMDDPATSDSEKQRLTMEMRTLAEEGNELEKERTGFLERSNSALNEKMVTQMRTILADINGLVAESAKAKGYNFVVDKSGLSTSQTPFVIYSDITDLTDELLIKLNKDASKGN